LIDAEQANLLLYNQYLEQIKASHYHTSHAVHPFTQLKEKFKKLFSRHKNEPQQDHQGIYDMTFDSNNVRHCVHIRPPIDTRVTV